MKKYLKKASKVVLPGTAVVLTPLISAACSTDKIQEDRNNAKNELNNSRYLNFLQTSSFNDKIQSAKTKEEIKTIITEIKNKNFEAAKLNFANSIDNLNRLTTEEKATAKNVLMQANDLENLLAELNKIIVKNETPILEAKQKIETFNDLSKEEKMFFEKSLHINSTLNHIVTVLNDAKHTNDANQYARETTEAAPKLENLNKQLLELQNLLPELMVSEELKAQVSPIVKNGLEAKEDKSNDELNSPLKLVNYKQNKLKESTDLLLANLSEQLQNNFKAVASKTITENAQILAKETFTEFKSSFEKIANLQLVNNVSQLNTQLTKLNAELPQLVLDFNNLKKAETDKVVAAINNKNTEIANFIELVKSSSLEENEKNTLEQELANIKDLEISNENPILIDYEDLLKNKTESLASSKEKALSKANQLYSKLIRDVARTTISQAHENISEFSRNYLTNVLNFELEKDFEKVEEQISHNKDLITAEVKSVIKYSFDKIKDFEFDIERYIEYHPDKEEDTEKARKEKEFHATLKTFAEKIKALQNDFKTVEQAYNKYVELKQEFLPLEAQMNKVETEERTQSGSTSNVVLKDTIKENKIKFNEEDKKALGKATEALDAVATLNAEIAKLNENPEASAEELKAKQEQLKEKYKEAQNSLKEILQSKWDTARAKYFDLALFTALPGDKIWSLAYWNDLARSFYETQILMNEAQKLIDDENAKIASSDKSEAQNTLLGKIEQLIKKLEEVQSNVDKAKPVLVKDGSKQFPAYQSIARWSAQVYANWIEKRLTKYPDISSDAELTQLKQDTKTLFDDFKAFSVKWSNGDNYQTKATALAKAYDALYQKTLEKKITIDKKFETPKFAREYIAIRDAFFSSLTDENHWN